MVILYGLIQILESLSGTFALITLIIIALVTYKDPQIGGAALVAFVGIVPAVLAYAEHKEEMAGK